MFDDDDCNLYDSDEIIGDESFNPRERISRKNRGQARRSYERLMEERLLKQQLGDETGYW